ncbi:MAG: RNA-dependent RNA polymerase [Guiyang cletus punctiger permutotetra-like virus 1]|nr:MAG: RNA-dependent RNA polymerase [Guiyang cletus punctiger permutotetra-like virus 1]
MDASNPVQDSTRMPISKIRDRANKFLRQDLATLAQVAQSEPRIKLPTLPVKPDPDADVKGVVQAIRVYKETRHKEIIGEKPDYKALETVLDPKDPMPVCSIMVDGVSVHPAAQNNKQGKVHVNLTFGGVGLDTELAAIMTRYLDSNVVKDLALNAPIYTRGTRTGFIERIKSQMGRPCKSSSLNYEDFREVMSRRLPISSKALIDWNQDIYDLVEMVETSYNSSAGAPYHRKKVDAIDDMLNAVLPLVHNAYCEEGGPDRLYREHPELYLCIVKNKDDRYEDPLSKTRPYVSLPWHFQTLFSVLSQSFSKALLKFTESSHSANAYGFSYAHGGAENLHKFACSTAPGEFKFAVYGDDVDLYFRHKNGNLMRCCPDFKQMDGSVDFNTIVYTVDYVYESFAKQFGPNQFWRNICDEWVKFAVTPEFIIEGTTVYEKKKAEGLMTGVVGTTLFDTVKSILAYNHYVSVAKDRPSLLGEKEATAFFKEHHSLEIKAGTWGWEVYNENPNSGETVSTQKFLGMRLMKTVFNGEDVFHPSLTEQEWMSLLLTPKRLDANVGKAGLTNFMFYRYLFDRLRGYLTTGGAFCEPFYRLCNSLLDNIPGASIAMAVQGGEGKGTKPELVHAVGDGFEFDSSMGWPTFEYVATLYQNEVYKNEQFIKMPPVFMNGEEPFMGGRKRPALMPKAAIVDVRSGGELISSSVVVLPEPEPPVVPDIAAKTGVAEKATRSKEGVVPNKKSKVIDLDTTTGEFKERKFVPTLKEQMIGLFKDDNLPALKSLDTLLSRLAPGGAPRLWNVDWLKSQIRLAGRSFKDNSFIEAQVAMNLSLDKIERVGFNEILCSAENIISAIAAPILPAQDAAKRLGITEKQAVKTARQVGLFVLGKEGNNYISPAPVGPVDVPIASSIEAQAEDNAKNLVNVTKEIKEAPIGPKTSELVAQKKQLLKTVSRADERPAMVPVKASYTGNIPFRYIQKFSINELRNAVGFNEVRVAATAILRENQLRYEREISVEGDLEYTTFTINNEVVVKTTDWGRGAFFRFFQKIIDMYISKLGVSQVQEEARKAGQDTWVELTEAAEKEELRVHLYQGRPILVHPPRVPVRLVGEHPKLYSVDNSVVVEGPAPIPLSLKTETAVESERKLNKLLGGGIKTELLTYNQFIDRYPTLKHVAESLKTLERKSKKGAYPSGFSYNLPRKRKNAQQTSDGSGGGAQTPAPGGSQKEECQSCCGHQSPQPQRQNQQQQQTGYYQYNPVPAPPQQQPPPLQNAGPREQVGGFGGLRLPRNSRGKYKRQTRGYQVPYQPQPSSMAGYQGPTGGPPLAEVQTQVFSSRSNNFGVPYDGRPVRRRMGRRF